MITKQQIDSVIEQGLSKSILRFKNGKPSIVVGIVGVSPWVLFNPNYEMHEECMYWFNLIEKLRIPRNEFIPIHCQNCYKVVARPESLEDVMELFGAMEKNTLYSKIGCEMRDSVPANWGAYFYNQSLEEGQICKTKVRTMVNKVLSPDHEVFLKRSCTENELPPTGMGDSLYWKPFEGQEEIEKYLKDNVGVYLDSDTEQYEFHLKKTVQMWVAFARGRGDKTYKKYIKNGDNFPEYRKY